MRTLGAVIGLIDGVSVQCIAILYLIGLKEGSETAQIYQLVESCTLLESTANGHYNVLFCK